MTPNRGVDAYGFPVYTSVTRKRETMKTKFPIIERAKIQARMCFKGIAIPVRHEVNDEQFIIDVDYVHGVADHKRYVVTEKVLKFNRKALRRLGKVQAEKADPRLIGGDDTMIIKVGKPGSRERVDALTEQYVAIMAHGEEISPFAWKDE